MRKTESNTIMIALAIIFVLTLLTMIVIQSPLANAILGIERTTALEAASQSGPTPSLAVRPLSDTDASAKLTLRSAALGFELEYPAGWRKRETTLQVVISPSANGLNPEELADSAIWIGIPANNMSDPADLLNDIVADFSPTSLSQETITIGGEVWNSAQIDFEAPSLGGESTATIAATSKNEVGYFIVAVAPKRHWNAIRPAFDQIMNSFRFSQQAVLRPTDATPPPTPTPTPTPVIYVVQPGDTLGGIAIQYGVDLEALANRNGIEDPRRLRSGQQLVIPIRR